MIVDTVTNEWTNIVWFFTSYCFRVCIKNHLIITESMNIKGTRRKLAFIVNVVCRSVEDSKIFHKVMTIVSWLQLPTNFLLQSFPVIKHLSSNQMNFSESFQMLCLTYNGSFFYFYIELVVSTSTASVGTRVSKTYIDMAVKYGAVGLRGTDQINLGVASRTCCASFFYIKFCWKIQFFGFIQITVAPSSLETTNVAFLCIIMFHLTISGAAFRGFLFVFWSSSDHLPIRLNGFNLHSNYTMKWNEGFLTNWNIDHFTTPRNPHLIKKKRKHSWELIFIQLLERERE